MPEQNELERVIADLYEVIRTQQQVLSYCVTTDEALMGVLAESLSGFEATFQRKHSYAENHPGSIGQALAALRGKLDAVEEKLRRRIGGWTN
jgi:hypothetical protein